MYPGPQTGRWGRTCPKSGWAVLPHQVAIGRTVNEHRRWVIFSVTFSCSSFRPLTKPAGVFLIESNHRHQTAELSLWIPSAKAARPIDHTSGTNRGSTREFSGSSDPDRNPSRVEILAGPGLLASG